VNIAIEIESSSGFNQVNEAPYGARWLERARHEPEANRRRRSARAIGRMVRYNASFYSQAPRYITDLLTDTILSVTFLCKWVELSWRERERESTYM